jgi:hypothetical protein
MATYWMAATSSSSWIWAACPWWRRLQSECQRWSKELNPPTLGSGLAA